MGRRLKRRSRVIAVGVAAPVIFGLLIFLGPAPGYAAAPPTVTVSALGRAISTNSGNLSIYNVHPGQKIQITVTARRQYYAVESTSLHIVGCTVQTAGVSRDPLDKVFTFRKPPTKGIKTITVPSCGYVRVQGSARDDYRKESFTGWMIFRVR